MPLIVEIPLIVLIWNAPPTRQLVLNLEEEWVMSGGRGIEKLDFSFLPETPDHGYVSLVNRGETVSNLYVKLEEDFDYSEGDNTVVRHFYPVGVMQAGETQKFRLVYCSPIDAELRKVKVEIGCSRGDAYGWAGWSWGYK